jgi:hypothetical protein
MLRESILPAHKRPAGPGQGSFPGPGRARLARCIGVVGLVLGLGSPFVGVSCVSALMPEILKPENSSGDKLHGDRLEPRFNALLHYRLHIVSPSAEFKTRYPRVVLEVPEEIAEKDPDYQRARKQSGAFLARATVQAASQPDGAWTEAGKDVVFDGQYVGQIRSGEYRWSLQLEDSSCNTLRLPMPGTVHLDPSAMNCVGSIQVELRVAEQQNHPSPREKRVQYLTHTRVLHDKDPSLEAMLGNNHPALAARFRNSLIHQEYAGAD